MNDYSEDRSSYFILKEIGNIEELTQESDLTNQLSQMSFNSCSNQNENKTQSAQQIQFKEITEIIKNMRIEEEKTVENHPEITKMEME